MSTLTITYSELSKRPGRIAHLLGKARRVRVTRRDGEDFYLTTASSSQLQDETTEVASKIFIALMKSDEGTSAILQALPEVFWWVRHLSDEDKRQFSEDLIIALRNATDLEIFERVHRVIVEWRATARILADPEETAILTAEYPDETYGEVLAP